MEATRKFEQLNGPSRCAFLKQHLVENGPRAEEGNCSETLQEPGHVTPGQRFRSFGQFWDF